jgi:hypothetical protein
MMDQSIPFLAEDSVTAAAGDASRRRASRGARRCMGRSRERRGRPRKRPSASSEIKGRPYGTSAATKVRRSRSVHGIARDRIGPNAS